MTIPAAPVTKIATPATIARMARPLRLGAPRPGFGCQYGPTGGGPEGGQPGAGGTGCHAEPVAAGGQGGGGGECAPMRSAVLGAGQGAGPARSGEGGGSQDRTAVCSSIAAAASGATPRRSGRSGGAGLGAASARKSPKNPRRSCALTAPVWPQLPSSCEPPHSHVIGKGHRRTPGGA